MSPITQVCLSARLVRESVSEPGLRPKVGVQNIIHQDLIMSLSAADASCMASVRTGRASV